MKSPLDPFSVNDIHALASSLYSSNEGLRENWTAEKKKHFVYKCSSWLMQMEHDPKLLMSVAHEINKGLVNPFEVSMSLYAIDELMDINVGSCLEDMWNNDVSTMLLKGLWSPCEEGNSSEANMITLWISKALTRDAGKSPSFTALLAKSSYIWDSTAWLLWNNPQLSFDAEFDLSTHPPGPWLLHATLAALDTRLCGATREHDEKWLKNMRRHQEQWMACVENCWQTHYNLYGSDESSRGSLRHSIILDQLRELEQETFCLEMIDYQQ